MTDGRSTASDAAFMWQPLRLGADFTLYRGRGAGSHRSLLGVTTTASHPSARLVDQLHREYALASKIQAGWAAKPLSIERHDGREILVLEDPGGFPLDMLIERRRGTPLDVADFLQAAIGLTEALGGVHRQGLIHKDIKPANVLMHDDGHAFLLGFGVASELPRQRHSLNLVQSAAGTPAYMSPEQTGRVSRVLDSRSDLYSLGITLYELLTARLPFQASGPMEWVHCHVARKPHDLNEYVRDVPQAVRDIIMKLLAKPAEERYASAEGLAWDLRQCLNHRTSDGAISTFSLGLRDSPDHIVVPENLYGRNHERAAMLRSLERVVAGGKPELLLVSGDAGVGKTALVREVFGVSRTEEVVFTEGKFEQHMVNMPLGCLAHAFQNPIRKILSGSQEDLARWRLMLQEALGSNAGVVIDLIPEIELIIGPKPNLPELPALEARNRFNSVMRRFVEVFTKSGRPLVIFFDDLQWADQPTLDLLEELLSGGETRDLLAIASYRSSEGEHRLAPMIARLQTQEAAVSKIEVTNLDEEGLNHLIADMLRSDRDTTRPLTTVVHGKTGGNPLFAVQFLQSLEDEALLRFGSGEARWTWDLEPIRTRHVSDNIAELLVAQIGRLQTDTQRVLQQLACIGTEAAPSFLADACECSQDTLHALLREAVRDGIVIYAEGRYAFEHDRIAEAAYSMVPDDAKTTIHLALGRLYWQSFDDRDQDGLIFQMVSQYNRGRVAIESPEERLAVAKLNLIAARRSQSAAAYASALSYLDLADELLSEDRWNVDHVTSFECDIVRSVCEMLMGDLEAAGSRLVDLGRRASTVTEKASVVCLQIDLYIIKARADLAVEAGVDFLALLGYVIDMTPSKDDVKKAFQRVKESLGDRPIRSLKDMPLSLDVHADAAVDVLNRLVLSALYQNLQLHQMLIALMVQISVANGTNAASAFGYVSFGRVLITEFADYSNGLEFGRLALDLVDRPGLGAFKGRVYFGFGTGISSWSRPLQEGLSYIRMALEEARRNGDLPYIGYSHSNIVGNLLSSGEFLPKVDRAAVEGLDFAISSGSRIALAFLTGQLRLIRSLRGEAYDFTDLDGRPFDPAAYEKHLLEAREPDVVADIYWSRRLQALVFLGEYAEAMVVADRVRTLSVAPWPNIEGPEYHFYAALACAGVGKEFLGKLMEHHRRLEQWSENSPDNLQCRAVLVSAEIARLEGRPDDAALLYDHAVHSARATGFVHVEALAWENASRFYGARGLKEIAQFHLERARAAYENWGADRIVDRLRRIGGEVSVSRSYGRAPSRRQFDVTAVLNASQALSGEIRHSELVDKLMRIVLDHAGADRATLTLTQDGEQQLVAEARAEAGDMKVVPKRGSIGSSLPQSVVRYVMRTGERVILDDATVDEIYSTDEYVRSRVPRSLMCMPIVRQANVIGMLYLENSLTPGAFREGSLAVLDVIASQAAISLENARLFSDLQRSESFLAQGQMISRTGSFGWSAGSGDFYWSRELYNILEYDPSVTPSAELTMERVHPEDRDRIARIVDHAMKLGKDFESEHRLLLPDGSVKFVHTLGRATDTENLDFVGSVLDVTDRVQAEEALREVRNDLAHMARVTTLNAMTASIAHEVNQPLSGILTNANAGLRFLNMDPPDIAAVTETLRRTMRDAKRASEVVQRLRSMAQRQPITVRPVDVNEAAQEVVAILGGEILKARAVLQTSYSVGLPPVDADRVQLQQVILNLLMNGIEAMASVSDRPRTIALRTWRVDDKMVRLDVQDAGTGLAPEAAIKLFEPFFTTKDSGLGIGLSICRSIIEGFDGRLWASPNDGPGTTFSFTLPKSIEK